MNSQNQTSRWNICSKNMLLVGKASRDREINKSQFPTKMKQSSGAVFAHTPHQYVDRFLEILTSFWKKSLALSMLGHIFWSCHAYCTWRFWNTLSAALAAVLWFSEAKLLKHHFHTRLPSIVPTVGPPSEDMWNWQIS